MQSEILSVFITLLFRTQVFSILTPETFILGAVCGFAPKLLVTRKENPKMQEKKPLNK